VSKVELVDTEGRPIGSSTVDDAHRAPGLLHRAFSVLLVDENGQLLLQRRAAGKTRFPLRWGNACCGHPAPGEPVALAAARRVDQELSIVDVSLAPLGVYMYRAGDPDTGRVEHEYDHVLLGRITSDADIVPDPTEVDDLRWVAPAVLSGELAAAPDRFAPWLAGVLALLPDGR
jgi:isopentenyl-diphosphate Delta-isomerase